jgi:hypothetical protein
VIKLLTSIKPFTVAITSAIMFLSLSSYAEGPQDGTGGGTGGGSDGDTAVENPYIETDAKRVKLNYPLGTMEQWLIDKDKFALNPVNIRAGKHPDREDPNGGPYDVIYIFPTEALANAWWNGVGTPPDKIPDDAVAFVHWELDNGSGAFPGIMSKADIDGFKSKNCIMAAGATIPVPGDKDGEEKTCNNPQGSSKRFKMNVLKADVPIDLVYNVEQADLKYTNYETPPTYDGSEESGRIYRVLQKWHNATAMDTANGIDNPGNRIVGFRLELGTGIGGSFNAIPNANDLGLDPDKSLGFELRSCMPDHFFDVKRDRPGTGTNPCSDSFDTTDQALPQEIWLEEEYSTFSPKMFSFNTDKRTTPVGGWWDKRPAGIYPPAVQTLGKLDSGTAASNSTTYFDDLRVDGATPLAGYSGGMTPNYFDIVEAQIANNSIVVDGTGINTPNPFGYLMYYGVLADDDRGILAQGIYADEDGDPATEGDLVAWWDGDEYRWGSDPDVNGEIDGDAFGVVPVKTLIQWALHPLVEETDFDKYPDTGFAPGPLYEIGVMDDLAGLNIDYFVYLGRKFTGNQFTIRLTTVSVEEGLNNPGDIYGNQTPAWVDSPAPGPEDFVGDDGVIDITALGVAGDPLQVLLADIVVGALPTVTIENLRTGETENVTLLQDTNIDLLWKFAFTQATVASGEAGGNNDGVLNVWPNDYVRVTYVDAFTGLANAPDNVNVVKTDQVLIPFEVLEPVTPTTASGDSGGLCSYNPNARFDPVLPALVLIGLAYLGLRRKTSSDK